jgi:3-oxoacyl-(acyl-carrier-protein) synthase
VQLKSAQADAAQVASARPGYTPADALQVDSAGHQLDVTDLTTGEPLQVFEELWIQAPLRLSQTRALGTLVCFLSGHAEQKALQEKIHQLNPAMRVVFVQQGPQAVRLSEFQYALNPEVATSYHDALDMIAQTSGAIEAILYLWPVQEQRYLREVSCVVYLLQGLLSARLKTNKLILSGCYSNDIERCHLESWIAFERSLVQVLPDIQLGVVFYQASAHATTIEKSVALQDWVEKLWFELQTPDLRSAHYAKQIRSVAKVRSFRLFETSESSLKEKGTYLITGGCGGLGMIFAKHLAQRYRAKLVLTGRSPVDGVVRQKLSQLERVGAQVLYVQADVADTQAMRACVAQAISRFGNIDGVLHIAGTSGAAVLQDATADNFKKVLQAKIDGTLVLNEVLGELQQQQLPDFVCYFSSSSAVLGDFGSCDYALANRFQMAFANACVSGEQQAPFTTKRIAINWPLWREGGLKVGDAEQLHFYLRSSGQRSLESHEGLSLFEQLLGQEKNHFLVLAGDPERLQRVTDIERSKLKGSVKSLHVPATPVTSLPQVLSELEVADIEKRIALDLKDQICLLLKTDPTELNSTTNLADFGFDSISLAEFSRVLSRFYTLSITPSVFFSYATLRSLTRYFINEHREAMQAFYRASDIASAPPIQACAHFNAWQDTQDSLANTTESVISSLQQTAPPETETNESLLNEPIAVIGMSGRFPGARNVDELWKILEQGINAVDEVPLDRFDWREIYGDSAVDKSKSNSKWVGSIPGIAEFDPLFFEISPLEAERMDPRQRHLLQESWLALEDAGYGPEQLARQKVGMFVGVEEGSDYHRRLKHVSLTSTHNGILASRLAYFLNLKGPVMALNTACSSSLVAAHQACQSLRQRECDTAIAAGVNLMVSPAAYVGMTQAGMLSPDGKCYVFDQRANGMVPGEAVAVVVLKRLSRALADGDPVHAVIRGTGVNYDGKTNGITAPSGISQVELLNTVYQQCGVKPDQIDYVVTHGTGTQLGDPIEINALYDVFKGKSVRRGYCALTSNKSNLGHTFAASGLVSLISLVQAIKHETIPASLHCENENDYIRWKDSPFYVNKQNKAWAKPAGQLRIGAVSAFGMSGTNAHMVLQNHVSRATFVQTVSPYFLLVLSAKTASALDKKMNDLLQYLQSSSARTVGLDSISYTMLQGRHHFQYRCAMVVRDVAQAIEVLTQVATSLENINVFRGIVERDFLGNIGIRQYLPLLTEQARALLDQPKAYFETLQAVADFYCQGYEIPGDKLFIERPIRVSLPGYPFEREHYWLEEVTTTIASTSIRVAAVTKQVMPTIASENSLPPVVPHTLVTRLSSSLELRQSVAHVTGDECFVARYEHANVQWLAPLFLFELVRLAAEQHDYPSVYGFKNIVLGKPLAYHDGQSQPLNINLHQTGDELLFSVSTPAPLAAVYRQIGELVFEPLNQTVLPRVELENLKAGLKPLAVEHFRPLGLLEPCLSVNVQAVSVSHIELIATLTLPTFDSAETRGMLFQPWLIHAGWHLLQCFSDRESGLTTRVMVPQALQSIQTVAMPPAGNMILHLVRRDGGAVNQQTYDLTFYDEHAMPCLSLRGFTVIEQERLANLSIE